MDMPCLSTVILTSNQRKLTERVVGSLNEFMLSADAEVILVDNGSSDGTQNAVMAKDFEWKERLKYIYLNENIGVAPGRNVGLKHASGDVILILDNDTIVDREALAYMLRRLLCDKTIGILAPALYSPSGELQDSAKPFPGVGIKVRHFISPKWRREDERAEACECEPFYVIGACQMFRREVMEKAGMLDERIFYGPEDADFCMRVRQAGFRIVYDPQVRIIHDWQRITSRRRFSRLSLLHIRSLIYFYLKHRRFL